MRTLVIGDIHLDDKTHGLLKAQIECIKDIIRKVECYRVIFLGDVFMHRKPSPSVLLALQNILGACEFKEVVILRGNHDSETKADDGVTALSVFENFDYNQATTRVITHTWIDHENKQVFIPHYESEETIKEALVQVPRGYFVFGHFGYRGCLNSAGDCDSTIRLEDFTSPAILGHIHRFNCDSNGNGGDVVTLGTPYTTNFGEAGKENYYLTFGSEKGERKSLQTHTVKSGPRHLIFNAKDIEANIEEINDPAYFTMLRVQVDADHVPIPYDKLNVASVDVIYNPVFNEEELSTFSPERNLFSINEVIIEDYVDGANSIIPKETLMKGYRELKDED
tara:strand:+ start:14134 stop:15144 length:1011 start_codon:yes stop_codon:yes gene_type:complete